MFGHNVNELSLKSHSLHRRGGSQKRVKRSVPKFEPFLEELGLVYVAIKRPVMGTDDFNVMSFIMDFTK